MASRSFSFCNAKEVLDWTFSSFRETKVKSQTTNRPGSAFIMSGSCLTIKPFCPFFFCLSLFLSFASISSTSFAAVDAAFCPRSSSPPLSPRTKLSFVLFCPLSVSKRDNQSWVGLCATVWCRLYAWFETVCPLQQQLNAEFRLFDNQHTP